MDYVTPDDIIKRFSKAKDHQPVEIAYMTPIESTREFKSFLAEYGYGNQRFVKIARIHTITNCKYSELPYVKEEREARAAAMAASPAGTQTPAPKKQSSGYNTILPGILQEKNGAYIFLTYPREGTSTEPGKLYCVLDENDEIIAQYDTIEPLRRFVSNTYINREKVDPDTGEIIQRPIKHWRLDRMYEVWPE